MRATRKRPANRADRARPAETRPPARPSVVRVPAKRWNRDEFLAWLDLAKARARIRSDLELAERAGISHTSISGWRNNRQRPSLDSLEAIARVFEVPARELWVRAGLVAPEQVEPATREPELDEEERMILEADVDEETRYRALEQLHRMRIRDKQRRMEDLRFLLGQSA